MSGQKTRKLPLVSGRYEIKDEIGSGGLSTVYQALDRQLNRSVALKRMNRAPDQRERDLVEQAWRESMTTASLEHPNIVRIFDFGFDAEGAYIVMELIEGENLEDCLERGPLHLDDFYRFTLQTLDALGTAHDYGLMHRDLKPGNFMLQRQGSPEGFTVKILDFGLAKYVNAPRPQSTDHLNAVMGSIYYMAPEQFQRMPVDHRTDLYAFGCILYEALTGYNAFYGETVSAIMQAHIHDKPASLRELRPEVSLKLEEWIMRFLEKQQGDRHQSAADALRMFPTS